MSEKEENQNPEEEELSPYAQMINERLAALKEKFDNFPQEEGASEAEKLPSFIMLHIAHLYARIDLLLGEIDSLKGKDPDSDLPEEVASDPEFDKAKADAEADIKKELAEV
jgi:hypothetical protein